MNTLETRVLELIGEDTISPDVFTDDSTGMAQIRESLNDSIEEISMLTGGHKAKIFVPLESGKNFYQLVPDTDRFAFVSSVWLVDQKRQLDQVDLVWLNEYNPRWLYSSSNPYYYFPIGCDKIAVHPTPASTADMLEIHAVMVPDRYTLDTDRIKLRKNFEWAAVHYAVSEYWASRGDAKSAIDSFISYLEKLGYQDLYPEAHEKVWEFKTK